MVHDWFPVGPDPGPGTSKRVDVRREARLTERLGWATAPVGDTPYPVPNPEGTLIRECWHRGPAEGRTRTEVTACRLDSNLPI